jgi:hypothetical protein
MAEKTQWNPSGDPITVSVVIPVHNAAAHLERCLTALSRSTYDRYECIVVDDGSTDASPQVARRHGARVIALAGNHGPAYARNRGSEAAQGDVLLFIDADVCVHSGTVGAVARAFAGDPGLAALMGSYDDQPGDPSFLSQYKNLFHHYVHQHGREEASTFWSGCGAMRRALFLELGGFNEGYAKACIEDIELGFRLRKAGHRIRLEKGIQATHLKRWDFVNLVITDLFRRGVPWVALMLRDRREVRDLNLTWDMRVSTVLTYLLVATLVVLAGTGDAHATLPILAALGLGVFSAYLHDVAARGTWQGVSVVGLVALAPVAWATGSFRPTVLLPLCLLLAIVGLHLHFYRFFASTRGLGFALGVLPFHLLYFLYSGVAVPLGVLACVRDCRQARKWSTGPAMVPFRPLEPESVGTPRGAEWMPQIMVAGAGVGASHRERSGSA